MRGGGPSAVKTVTVTIDGVTHHGAYFVQSSMVNVRSTLGSKTTQVGGSPPKTIAKLLLSELVREAKGK
jgi:hypothetical protein